jgi:hypothetical protein
MDGSGAALRAATTNGSWETCSAHLRRRRIR